MASELEWQRRMAEKFYLAEDSKVAKFCQSSSKKPFSIFLKTIAKTFYPILILEVRGVEGLLDCLNRTVVI